jgi:antirestriction protein ArdC
MHDIYASVTARILAELEAGTPPWVRPWSGEAYPVPCNALTKRHYRGINTIVLGMEAHCHGYSTNLWCTFRQALHLGGHVRKGERSSTIVFYELKSVTDEESQHRNIPVLRLFSVFNVDQVDGLPSEFRSVPAADPAWDPSAAAEQVITGSDATILHQGFRAFYSPASDRIYLPVRSTFADAGGYYATALHELCHWTGSRSRLGRKLGGRFGEAAYAMEELVAELGAAFLSAHCHLDGRLQHASYIASWLGLLRRDKRAVFVAAAPAQKAADYLLTKAGLINPIEAVPVAA